MPLPKFENKCAWCKKKFGTNKKIIKYCSKMCQTMAVNWIDGQLNYFGYCQCDKCQAMDEPEVWVSHIMEQEYKRTHQPKPPENLKQLCKVCFENLNGFIIKQDNYELHLCAECYVKIMERMYGPEPQLKSL